MTINPQTPTATEPVQFSGATSTAPNGTIVKYHWEFGDGQSATGVSAWHTYEVPGTYTVTLTVLDNVNAGDQASVTLDVQSLESQQQRRRILASIIIINTILLDEKEEAVIEPEP